MRRSILAVILIVHGLAHSAAGIWATTIGPTWAALPLWLVAEAGFVAAGLGLAGVRGLRSAWQPIAFFAGVSSVALLASFGALALLAGLLIDVVLLILATLVAESPAGLATAPNGGSRRLRALAGNTVAWAFLAYVCGMIVLRPWHTRWGVSDDERAMQLPGDELVYDAHYRLDHAITIDAPADSVWPWLAQIGQDRAGFYSYDRLERLIGDDIHNADRIHPEWQDRRVGDLVRAVQPDYLGGRLGSAVGWHVLELQRGRALVLDKWGAFVVVPVDEHTSRVHIRTRGAGTPDLRGVVLGPVSLLVFEPAHFIMERRMLLGIRDRAERRRDV
ncbi:MAG: hypothetical protein ACJ79K_14695 [Gemmatimonadaceae bacterium]